MKDCYNFLGTFFKVKCSYLLHIYIKKTPQRCYITILYIIYINIFCNDGFISSVDIFAVLTSGFSIRLIHIEPVFHQVLDLQVTDCDGLLHIRWCSQHDITQTGRGMTLPHSRCHRCYTGFSLNAATKVHPTAFCLFVSILLVLNLFVPQSVVQINSRLHCPKSEWLSVCMCKLSVEPSGCPD